MGEPSWHSRTPAEGQSIPYPGGAVKGRREEGGREILLGPLNSAGICRRHRAIIRCPSSGSLIGSPTALMESGCTGYLTKPISREILREALRHYLPED